ncbi:hypothetical protein vseg_004261 [Gypsophila vaccaria]
MGEVNGNFNGVDNADRVHEWEAGLPNFEDITPLSHGLIPPELLSAFNITPEPYRTSGDVAHASQQTISSIRGSNFGNAVGKDVAAAVVEELLDEDDGDVDDLEGVSAEKKHRRNVSPEDADSAAADEKAAKRARLVWTPQLHKRFVEVVAHLGIKNAVPKTIMQLMNVEGLTRENVASHLQKYRLYLKRNQGFSSFDHGHSNSSAATAAPSPLMNHHHQQQQQQYQYNSSNGVMHTGNNNNNSNNNMYGRVVAYHQNNHLNHNYPPHVAPGEQ